MVVTAAPFQHKENGPPREEAVQGGDGMRASGVVAGIMVAGLVSAGSAHADSAADFYRGKQITMVIPSDAGGGYDLYARFLAQYMGEHIPGKPRIVAQNMPGAGGIVAANYLYARAPKDGLTIGAMENTITLNQLIKSANVKFDVRRFEWLGSMSTSPTICLLSGKAKNLNIKDLFRTQVTLGATAGSPSMIPQILNDLAGTRFKIILGYPGTSDVQLAMRNGEVEGICGLSWDGARITSKQMIDSGKAKVALDLAIQPDPELEARGVPFFINLLPQNENKKILKMILSTQVYNRPFTAPPGVPKDRLQALRDAFAATVRDPNFQARAKKAGLDLAYLDPNRINELIDLVFGAPADIQHRTAEELKKAGLV